MTAIRIPNQRAVIDRRGLTVAIDDVIASVGAGQSRPQIVELLRGALAGGRAEIARRLAERPSAGNDCAAAQAFLVDQLLRIIHDHVVGHVYRASNRSTGERLAIMAVGGYGRGEMAPHSDVDIAFLTPGKQTSWCEQVIEAMLYFLWDLGLKIGHSSRSLDEMVRMSRSDITIRTAMLEGRYVWGDQPLFDEARRRFFAEVVAGTERQFVTEKLADSESYEIHPDTIRLITRDAKLIDAGVRRDPRANALFLDLLTSRHDPETVLRWLNESGVFGRFIPEFARVNAQMQFDMYHHYTVDEHTIRAIGLLSRIEKGELANDHPLGTEIFGKLLSRRATYAAVLLHDIAKGRGGDHSVLGAEIALKLCPRLGMDADETQLVSWLVRRHLLMSDTSFKRDLADYKTISDFVAVVETLERLRQLTLLTIVDIRAVGPGVWNSWKRQLLQELYRAAEERLRLGHVQHHRAERIAAKKRAVTDRLGNAAKLVDQFGKQFADAYWIAEPEDVIAMNLRQFAEAKGAPLTINTEYDAARGATLVMVIAADHPGLFYRIAGGIHLAGGNIIDAHIHTTRNGTAVDNFLVQDPLGRPFSEESQLQRLKTAITDALANRLKLVPQLAARPLARPRAEAFEVESRVEFDNSASNRFTVVEVAARDRPALLNRLARALFESRLIVHSAHITTYGERAVDTFYVTDLFGGKVDSASRMKSIEKRLLEAGDEEVVESAA